MHPGFTCASSASLRVRGGGEVLERVGDVDWVEVKEAGL